MPLGTLSLPKVSLERIQWIRLVVVGLFVVLAAARVAPDLIRAVVPLGDFDYVTDGNGVVIGGPAEPGRPAGDGRIVAGDRVRVDRIPPFDRKGGIVGVGYTYDNPDRVLPVLRDGHERKLHLRSRPEPITARTLTLLRIAIFLAIVLLGAILFLIAPGIATGAILAYGLCNDGPSTWLALQIPNPWRQVFDAYASASTGAAGSALLLFALCLLFENPRAQRLCAYLAAASGAVSGTLHAYGYWLATYAARPAGGIDATYGRLADVTAWVTIGVFAAALVRAHGSVRRRIGWIACAFALAAVARLVSQAFYPEWIKPWENGVLLSASVLPILVVWVAVVREKFFNVDFVVSRAVVYVALSATVIGIISASEEIGTYVFYQNTDLAYGFLIAISMVVGSTAGKLRELIESLVDRFIFRDRAARQRALALIAGYTLDAETREDVERALLVDASHALDLAFGGIFERTPGGSFRLGPSHNWPADCDVELPGNDDLLEAIHRSRGPLRFSGKDSKLVRGSLANARLTFVAPLFFERSVYAIVVYGHSQIGLDLDPAEREALIELIAHASIALAAIELARYRKLALDQANGRTSSATPIARPSNR